MILSVSEEHNVIILTDGGACRNPSLK